MQNTSITEQNYKSLFAWDNFKRLDKSDREELIRFSIEQIRTEKGLKKVDVEFFCGDTSSRGSCSQDFKGKKCVGHIINLNDDILTEEDDYYSPYKIFNTINHELEHASQYKKAFGCWKLAGFLGKKVAISNIAFMYYKGIYVKCDYKKSLKYYKKNRDENITNVKVMIQLLEGQSYKVGDVC